MERLVVVVGEVVAIRVRRRAVEEEEEVKALAEPTADANSSREEWLWRGMLTTMYVVLRLLII